MQKIGGVAGHLFLHGGGYNVARASGAALKLRRVSHLCQYCIFPAYELAIRVHIMLLIVKVIAHTMLRKGAGRSCGPLGNKIRAWGP